MIRTATSAPTGEDDLWPLVSPQTDGTDGLRRVREGVGAEEIQRQDRQRMGPPVSPIWLFEEDAGG